MPNEPVTEAITAYTALLAGETFPSPSIDIDDDDFALPALSGLLATTPAALTIADLTEKVVDGDGAFDVLMSSIKAHIQEEYDAGRITGREYSETYIALVTAAMSTAAQFLIQKDTAAYTNALTLMQARAAQIGAVIAAAELAKARQLLVLTEFQTLTAKTDYAQGKMNIGILDITYSKLEQEVEIGSETKRQLIYQTDYVLSSQVAKVEYETEEILPKQAEGLGKDNTIKQYQISTLLVDQHNILLEQLEVQRAQTMDTRVDGTTSVTGAIGKQKELYDEQISSYVKDARYKAAKIWSDSWIAQKSLDEGLLAPDQFSNANVNVVLASIKTALDLD